MTRLIFAAVAALVGFVAMATILVLGLPFWLVGATTRVFARLFEPRWLPATTLTEYAPVVGWKPRANVDGYHCVDDVFHVTTDGDGWRGQRTIEDSDIVVLGDSFAWGYGIDDDHFFANLVPAARVKTIGVMGYNLAQEFLWLERLAPRLSGKLVVWFIYLGNDLIDNVLTHKQGRRMPFMRQVHDTDDWEIVTSHVNPSRWPYTGTYGAIYYEALAQYCTVGGGKRREYAACESLLGRGMALCDAVGARLVILTIPDKAQLSRAGHELLMRGSRDRASFDADLPDHAIRGVCKRLQIPFVAGKQYFDVRDYKARDVHWNEAGHRRMAGILSELYTGDRAGMTASAMSTM